MTTPEAMTPTETLTAAYDYIVKYVTPKYGHHADEGGLNFFQDQHQ